MARGSEQEEELRPILDAVEKARAKAGKEPCAVFDFDNTCIVNDIGEAVFAYLCGHELLRDRTLLGTPVGPAYHERVFHTYHALIANGRLKAAYMLCARSLAGFTPGEAEAVALAAITEEGRRLGSKMLYDVHIERGLATRPKVLELMSHLRAAGVRIWIVSASAEPAVRAAMRHFGIESEVVGVRSALRDGAFTTELEEPMPMFEGKAECVKRFIGPNPLLAVGDTKNDLAMLELAGIKVAIEGRELADTARERGWFVM